MVVELYSLDTLTDDQLSRFRQDKATEILQAMERAGNDMVAGRITPEQSDIDIGVLLAELKLVENEVSAEQLRRSKRKQTGHRIMLIVISVLAAGFFYFVFSN